MFKYVAATTAEELTSHWSDTLALPLCVVALRGVLLVQVGLSVVFLVTWTLLKIHEHHDQEKSAAPAENTVAK